MPLTVPRLVTDRMILRGHRPDDLDASAAMWADPEVVRHISGTVQTREQCWSRLLRYAGHWSVMGYGYWLAEAREDGRFLGEIGLADYRRAIDPPLDAPEAGWVMAPAAQGRGLASEGLAAVLAWADAQVGPRIVAIIAPEHAASIRVAQKAGFRLERHATYLGAPTLVMGRDAGG